MWGPANGAEAAAGADAGSRVWREVRAACALTRPGAAQARLKQMKEELQQSIDTERQRGEATHFVRMRRPRLRWLTCGALQWRRLRSRHKCAWTGRPPPPYVLVLAVRILELPLCSMLMPLAHSRERVPRAPQHARCASLVPVWCRRAAPQPHMTLCPLGRPAHRCVRHSKSTEATRPPRWRRRRCRPHARRPPRRLATHPSLHATLRPTRRPCAAHQ